MIISIPRREISTTTKTTTVLKSMCKGRKKKDNKNIQYFTSFLLIATDRLEFSNGKNKPMQIRL